MLSFEKGSHLPLETSQDDVSRCIYPGSVHIIVYATFA